MPCYNEAATILEVADRVLASPFTAELIIVDDASTDGTSALARSISDPRVRVLTQPFNQGKGAALRRGFPEATADFVIVQDADLEYDPSEYGLLLGPLLDGSADVVFGSRFAMTSRTVSSTSGTRWATRSSRSRPTWSPTSTSPTSRPATRRSGAR